MKLLGNIAGGILIAAGLVFVLVGVLAIPAWVAMLLAGALAGGHNLYSPGFWEVLQALWLISIVGSAWRGVQGKVESSDLKASFK